MDKNKKGFVFIETVIVLVVLVVSLMGLYSMFSHVVTNASRRESYDNINDIYKVNIIKKLLTYDVTQSYLIIDKTNCSNYMNTDCEFIFEELSVEKVLITNMNINELIKLNIDIPNTMKEYLKTINKNNRSIVVGFTREEAKNYSSLEIR